MAGAVRYAIVDDATAHRCPRCKSTLKGNALAVTHGLRSRPELHPDTQELFLDRVKSIQTDNGQANDPAYIFASQSRDYVRLELLIETRFAHAAERGASPKVIDQLLGLIAAKARLASQIGLQRKAGTWTSRRASRSSTRGRARDAHAGTRRRLRCVL